MRNWLTLLKWLTFILFIIGTGWTTNHYIPGQHLPWKALDTARPLGSATKSQILRLSLSPSKTCMALARDTVGFKSIPADPKSGPTSGDAKDICGWDVARVVYGQGDTVFTPGEANMQCPLSIATYLWTREIDKIARERYGEGLAKIHHKNSPYWYIFLSPTKRQ